MSPTLFWYVFKDLLRVFLLAVLALAGIMSFGGLLQPLTKNGLEASQVGRMLGYLLPAMTTYSLPIAALFATTMVYGRLSADNELTACRAGGISYFSIATPAFLLGLVVSISSLLLLCFIVPGLTLEAEKIVRSNIARLVTTSIQRNHQIRLENMTIYAQDAAVGKPHSSRPNDQVVILLGPMFVNYQPTPKDPKGLAEIAARDTTGKVARELENMKAAEDRMARLRQAGIADTSAEMTSAKADYATANGLAIQYATELRVPRDFWICKQATAYVSNDEENRRVNLVAEASDGNQFPRVFAGSTQGGVSVARFGPINLPSPVREHPKFMNIFQLKTLLADRRESRAIREIITNFHEADQEAMIAGQIIQQLNTAGTCVFDTGNGETYTLRRGDGPASYRESLVIVPSNAQGSRTVRMQNQRGNASTFAVEANLIRLRPIPDNANRRVGIAAEFFDAVLSASDATVPHVKFTRSFSVPMSEQVFAVTQRTPETYLSASGGDAKQREFMRRVFISLGNYIQSEMHARTSFSISCLILVITGASLGMMFKSGNFLSAFAVSVVPALVCIVLIVTGQHTVENIPRVVTAANNPLNFGIAIIWSGNLLVFLLGGGLLWRLQRQ